MNTFEQKVIAARNEYDNNRFDEASKLYLNALNHAASNKDSSMVWAELSWTFYKQNAYEQCIEAAENSLNYDIEYGAREDLYRLIGFSYSAKYDQQNAEKYLLKSIEIDRHSEKQKYVFYELGKIYFKQQNYQAAELYFSETEKYFKTADQEYWLSFLFFKGFIKYHQNKLDESKKIFNQLLKLSADPVRQSSAFYGLAFITFKNNDYLKTINLCETISKINPDFFDMETLGFLMAASFFYLGRYDVFVQYDHQMQKHFKNGRYEKELTKLRKKLPPDSKDKK